jgi:hypothetical protein
VRFPESPPEPAAAKYSNSTSGRLRSWPLARRLRGVRDQEVVVSHLETTMMPLEQRDRFQSLDGRVGPALRVEKGPLPVRGYSKRTGHRNAFPA